MSFTQSLKLASIVLVLGVAGSGVGLLARSAGSDDQPQARATAARSDEIPVHSAMPGKLSFILIEKGSLESSENKDAYCRVEGQTTIIMIKPEGTPVKEGELICQLDSASLNDQLINQKITTKSAEANHENAKLSREVAEFAVLEYEEGTLKQERSALRGVVAVAQSAIQKAETRLQRVRGARKQLSDMLAAKGVSASTTDIMAALDVEDRHDAAEQTLLTEQKAMELAKSKQQLLEKYTSGKTIKELKGDVERKRSVELAKKAVWELESMKERKLLRQILNCDITAPADGILVYANDPSRAFGSRQPQIEEGATVRERQKIFSLPDITRMAVNAKVHERWVDQLARNMKARIHVDAFANETLNGTVLEIAPLPDPANSYSPGMYTTRIKIDRPLPGLKPGMTAQVEVLVNERDNVLSVPVEAVFHYDNKDHVAVKKPGGGFEWREVTLGLSNEQQVEVKQGILSGELVAIKPGDLLSEEQKRAIHNSPTPPARRRSEN